MPFNYLELDWPQHHLHLICLYNVFVLLDCFPAFHICWVLSPGIWYLKFLEMLNFFCIFLFKIMLTVLAMWYKKNIFFLHYFIVLHISNCTHLVSRKQLSLYLLVDAWILRLPPQLVLGNSIMCQTSLCPLDLCHSNGQVSCWWHRECCSCGSEP